MKKTFFTLMLLAVVSFMSAQNLRFECNGEVYQDGQTIIATFDETMFEYVAHLHIRNLTDNYQNVIVVQDVIEGIDDALTYMCWDQCAAPNNHIEDGPVAIPAQSLSDNELSCHVMFSSETVGVVKVNYSAFDRANPDEKVSIIVLFGPNAGADEYNVSLGQAYPNPATTQVNFDLQSDSNVNLVVYNLLGQEVKSQFVSSTQGRISISVDDLQPGIYFCSFRVNNDVVKTEKFIVKR